MDLNHKSQYIAGLALAALGNICSAGERGGGGRGGDARRVKKGEKVID